MSRESSTTKKRKLRFEIYKKLLNYTCAHPECNSGLSIEAHHIRPLKKGGEDKFWNIIGLCWSCHHTKKLHSHSEEVMTELYVYKLMHERKTVGFNFDELEDGFMDRYKNAIKECKSMEAEEKFIAENLDNIKV